MTIQSMIDVLRRHAAERSERLLCSFSSDGTESPIRWTYQDVDEHARRIAGWLQEHNMAERPVLLAFPPSIDFVAAFLGCLYAKSIAVPTPPPRRNPSGDRFLSIYRNCQPAAVLTSKDVSERIPMIAKKNPVVEDLPWHVPMEFDASWADAWRQPEAKPETIAFIQYTSGSTGDPRGVVVDHGNLLHNQELIQKTFGQTEDMVMVGWLPMHHDMGLVGTLLHPLTYGGSVHLMSPVSFVQSPIRWLKLMSDVGATISTAPNFAYELCINRVSSEDQHGLDLSSLQTLLNGAEPVRVSTLQRFTEKFKANGFRQRVFCPCYGMAESTLLVSGVCRDEEPLENLIVNADFQTSLNHSGGVQAATDCPAELVHCGRPLPDVDVRIVDPVSFQECQEMEIGEVWVAGGSVARGYWEHAEATTTTFNAKLKTSQAVEEHKSYLRTGDLGLRRDGRLYIAGRLKDVIIINGVNYYPHDLEATASAAHEGLVDGRAVAFGFELDGVEEVGLVLEASRELLSQVEDSNVLNDILSAIQQTWEIAVAAVALVRPGTVPITSSGKVQRQLTKQRFIDGEFKLAASWQRPSAKSTTKQSQSESKTDTVHSNSQGIASETSKDVTELQDWMQFRLSQLLGIKPNEIDIREPFARYGLKSVQAVQFCSQLSDHLNRKVEPVLAYDYPNIAALSRYLLSSRTADPVASSSSSDRSRTTSDELIAVIGIGCRFPSADSPNEFWELLARGDRVLSAYPTDRWDNWQPPLGESCQQTGLPPKGGFLDRIDQFDPLFFGINPREAALMDPQQRLALEVCWETLEHAGINPHELKDSQTGVFLGLSNNDYLQLQTHFNSEVTGYNATGSSLAMAANRISYTLNLRGPSLAIDTACSSSLVAVHYACESLRRGESDLALCGGVNLISAPMATNSLAQAGMLSESGESAAFLDHVDGYVRGEGCGMVLVKRLSDALHDHDNIVAVISGTAINHDGRSNGLTAPSGVAQQQVIRKALESAKVELHQIDYLEAHGTGTTLGDQIELNALQQVFGRDRCTDRPLQVGSVKSNLGHLEAAAGIAGLIKVCLAIHHGEVPAHVSTGPQSHFLTEQSALLVQTTLSTWSKGEHPRLASVSSFGFGGTNAHCVIQQAPVRPDKKTVKSEYELVVLTARTQSALQTLAQRLSEQLPNASLAAIAYSANTSRALLDQRLAILAKDRDDLKFKLQSIRKPQSNGQMPDDSVMFTSAETGEIVWSFGNRESQAFKLFDELRVRSDDFQKIWQQLHSVLETRSSIQLVDLLTPNGVPSVDQHFRLRIFCSQWLLGELFKQLGVRCDSMRVEGFGIFAGVVALGVLDLATMLDLISGRVAIEEVKVANLPIEFAYRESDSARHALLSRESLAIAISRELDRECPRTEDLPATGFSVECRPNTPARMNGFDRQEREALSDFPSLLGVLAKLFVQGIDINWRSLYPRDSACVQLPTYPFERQPYWLPNRGTEANPTEAKADEWLHPLLHQHIDLAGGDHVFQSDLSKVGYLQEHRVNETAILPIAGILEMACAAGRRIAGSILVVEELAVATPVVIEADEPCIVQLMLKSDGAEYHGSLSQRAPSGWVERATFKLSLNSSESEAPCQIPAALMSPMSNGISIQKHYDRLREHGLQYGPEFQRVRQLFRDTHHSWAVVTNPMGSFSETACIHPTTLDGCLQTIVEAIPDAVNKTYLPAAVKRFQLLKSTNSLTQVVCCVEPAWQDDTAEYITDLKLLDLQGHLVARLSGLRLKPAEQSQTLEVGCYQAEWQPRLRSKELPPQFIPSSHQLRSQLRQQYLVEYNVAAVDDHLTLLNRLEIAASACAAQTLITIGLDYGESQTFTFDNAVHHCSVVSSRKRLFRRLLQIAVEDELLAECDDGFRVAIPVSEWPQPLPESTATEVALFRRCVSQLPNLLTSEIDPLPILFPTEPGLASASDLYHRSVGSRALNHLVAEMASSVELRLPAGRGLSILEVGAGTGATTRKVLERLDASRVQYAFTDVSPHFLATARESFATENIEQFETLDLEVPPSEQGFELQSFDLVIAANVVHATTDVRRSLEHVRQLMRPNGLLILVEGTRRVRWLDLMFGMTDGWWSFQDDSLRSDHPMISWPQWQKVFERTGFKNYEIMQPQTDHCPIPADNSLLIVQASDYCPQVEEPDCNWVVFGSDRLSAQIADEMNNRQRSCVRQDWPNESFALSDFECFESEFGSPIASADTQTQFYIPSFVIVHPDNESDVEGLSAHILETLDRLRSLVQKIAEEYETSDVIPSVVFVTRDSQIVGESIDCLGVQQAAWHGFARTLALEFPDWRVQCIDLESAEDSQAVRACVDELLYESSEPEIVFCDAKRYVRRLESLDIETDTVHSADKLSIDRRGTLAGLRLESHSIEQLDSDEILVDVVACGLNFRDVLNTLGLYPGQPPLGAECTGIIRQVGCDVGHFEPGDRVAIVAPDSICDRIQVQAKMATRIPESISLQDAASIPIAFLTAAYSLWDLANLQKEERLLIHSAAGGVGLAAVQLGHLSGAEVLATSSVTKQEFLRQEMSVDHVFNSREHSFAKELNETSQGAIVDVLLNTLGEEFIDDNLSVLKPGGRYIDLSMTSQESQSYIKEVRPDVEYYFVNLVDYLLEDPDRIREQLSELFNKFESGELRPLPIQEFPLGRFREAFRYLQSAKNIGKVVLTTSTEPNFPSTHEQRPSAEIEITDQGCYVITGGLGGLGLETLEYLASRGASNVVLLGRNAPTDEHLARIERVRAMQTEVTTSVCDVSNYDDLSRAVEMVRSKIGPIRGIVHSAGTLADGRFASHTGESFRTVFQPKVYGAWNLHRATIDDRLDFFVLYSSIAGYLGSPGQINHSAANTFLDGLATYRRSRGLPAISIAWGPWAQVGAAVRNGRFQPSKTPFLELIAPTEGIHAFDKALRSPHSQLAIMKFNPQKLSPHLQRHPLFEHLLRQPAVTSKDANEDAIPSLSELPANEVLPFVRRFLRQRIAFALAIDDELQIGDDAAFFDLGLDSLTTLELKEELQAAWSVSLPSSLFFDYPNLRALSVYMADLVAPNRERDDGANIGESESSFLDMVDSVDQRSEFDGEDADELTEQKLMDIAAELSQWDDA